jgi:Na+/glutamate symporter
MSPDTQQNILYALFFLVLHNFVAIAYASGLAIATIIALLKPTRGRILLMVGFSLLLLSFEYAKHIQDPLLEQTKQSLITERYSSRLERVITLTIGRVAPYTLTVGGVTGICIGGFLEVYALKRKKRQSKSG